MKFESMKDVASAVYDILFANPGYKANELNYKEHTDFPGDDGNNAAVVLALSAASVQGQPPGKASRFFRAVALFAEVLEKHSEGHEDDDPAATRMVHLCVLAQDALLINAGIRTFASDGHLQEHLKTCERRWAAAVAAN